VLPYDEAGAGPAVVLLHTGIADRTMWLAPLETPEAFRALLLDFLDSPAWAR
jgi:hypothetical protein